MKTVYSLVLILILSVCAFAQQQTGNKAQGFSEVTIAGESIDLDQLRGKVVVLTFWSTRCEICVAEIPRLNKLVDKYAEDEVVFVGFAWQDKTKLEEFMAKRPFKFKIVAQSLGVLLKYGDRDSQGRLNVGFPSHFVVGQDGNVEFKASGFDKTSMIDATISKLLSTFIAAKD